MLQVSYTNTAICYFHIVLLVNVSYIFAFLHRTVCSESTHIHLMLMIYKMNASHYTADSKHILVVLFHRSLGPEGPGADPAPKKC